MPKRKTHTLCECERLLLGASIPIYFYLAFHFVFHFFKCCSSFPFFPSSPRFFFFWSAPQENVKKQIESVFLALVWYCMVFCGWWIGDGMGNFILPVLHVAERRRLRRSISNLCLRYGATREGNGNVHKVSPNCDSWKISHRMQSAVTLPKTTAQ